MKIPAGNRNINSLVFLLNLILSSIDYKPMNDESIDSSDLIDEEPTSMGQEEAPEEDFWQTLINLFI